MSVIEVLETLKENNINLKIVKDNLVINAPKGRLKRDLISLIKHRKDQIIEFIRRTNIESKPSIICQVEKREYYKLSSAQKRMYIIQQLDAASTGYNLPGKINLDGRMNKDKLEMVFKRLMNRHESLRTSFEIVDGRPVQRVHNYREVEFQIEYYSAERRANIFERFVRPFALSKAPLFRIGILAGESNHILLVDMHHIISDALSMRILEEEFHAFINGEEFPGTRFQYKDFAGWQNSEEYLERLKQQEEYWLIKFPGEIPVLNLPVDYPRPAVQSFAGSRINFILNEIKTGRIREIAEESGATLYMVILSVINILFSKLSGQEDIIIGTPVAARRHADLEQVIGMFVNTLALRNFPGSNKKYKEFLNEIRESTLEAYENQEYPFEELLDKLSVERDTSRNALFDIMFSHTDYGYDIDINKEEKQVKEQVKYEFEKKTSKFDISIDSIEEKNRISILFEYCTDLFKKETIERFFNYLDNIILTIISNPGIVLEEIEIIPGPEKEKILYEFNNTRVDYPENRTIIDLFEEQVGKTPGNTAVVFKTERMTYRELNERSNQLAGLLREKGVAAGVPVGIIVESSNEMITGIIGILKSGGAYLPVDIDCPPGRIASMLNDSGAKFVLTRGNFVKDLPQSCESINLDLSYVYKGDYENLKKVNKPDDLAYIIYTSGSTGNPKGVVIEHRNIYDYILTFIKNFKISNSDVVLQQHSTAFDASMEEIYPVLSVGGKLVIVGKVDVIDSDVLTGIIEKEKITVVSLSPLLLSELSKVNIKKLQGVRLVISGGDILKKEYFRNIISEKAVFNTYGPTEGTVCAAFYKCEDRDYSNVPIGKPIENTYLYILRKGKGIFPIGGVGELCISGAGVARGYLNRVELTDEKFITNLFIEGERLYKTGDLCQWLPDGNIEFIGRIDNQIQLRGFRIEAGEIENRLLHHKEIKEAVVLAREDKFGNKCLYAYIGSDNHGEIKTSELREYLLKKLPDYMVPANFLVMEELPKNLSGKIDRRALSSIEKHAGKETIAPVDKIEKKIAAIWAEVLNIEKESIGTNSNFFELGGHSLKAVNVTAKVHKEFNVKISVADIFRRATVKELAGFIQECGRNDFFSIESVEEKEYYVLSSAQERLYILQQLDLESTNYNIPYILQLEEKIEEGRQEYIGRIEQVFRKLISRHESLRTSFWMVNDVPVQIVHEEVEFAVENVEYNKSIRKKKYRVGGKLEGKSVPHVQSEIPLELKRVIESFVRPFDLSKAPLLRVCILKTGKKKSVLLFDLHHIITDGVSQEIFEKEFLLLYAGEELKPLKLQYKDFSGWQNSSVQAKLLKEQEKFWLQQFSGKIPVLQLPFDYPMSDSSDFSGDRLIFELGTAKTKELKELALTEEVTLFMVLLAIFNVFLSKITGQTDIVVGTAVMGRKHPDLWPIMGMFINMLALRNFPLCEKHFREFLKDIKKTTLNAFENQDYPFEDLVEKTVTKRGVGESPLFNVAFSVQEIDPPRAGIPGLKLKSYNYEYRLSKFDMTLFANEPGEKLNFYIGYKTRQFKRETIENYAELFKEVVSSVLENRDVKLRDIRVYHGLVSSKSDLPRIDFGF